MIITLPSSYKEDLLVKVGQKVDFKTPFFKKKIQKEIGLSLAEKLRISPQKIFVYLKKFVGEKINKGEILAEKKTLFTVRRYRSEYQGEIKEIDHQEGKVLIKINSGKDEFVTAPFKGEILEIDKETIKIKVNRGKEFTAKEITADFGGEVTYLKPTTEYCEEEINNKIVVGQSLSSYLQVKLEALGVKGFVLLHRLPEKTDLPWGQLKNITDWEKIIAANFPYCLVDKKNSKIYFYA